MSIRVSSNQMMYNYKKQLNDANSRQDKLLEQGDGNKLHRPSDDSVAYTKYLRYDTSSQENTQYQENVNTGISWMKASDSALVSMTNIQTTFKEKTVAAANDTNNTSDRAAIGKEMMAEIQELVSLGNTMQGDRYLFAGQKDTTMPFSLSEEKVFRGQAKTLDDKASAYFSGEGTATTAGSIKQMLTLTGSDGNTYYLNTKDGYIYTQDFVDSGYKFKVTENANAVVDPTKDSVGKLDGWGSGGTESVSKYFKNTGEIIDTKAELSGATKTAGNTEDVDVSGLTFTFKTVEQQIASYQGDAKYISMTKKNGTTEPTSDTVNVNGPDIWGTDIFDNADSGNTASGTAMLNSMLTVHAKVVGEDVLYLKDDAQTLSDEAHATTVNTETKLGARQQLYTSVKTMLGNQKTLIQGDITDVMSADVAQLATKLMEAQTVYNMSLALGARILPSSLADYLG
ncbi:MAG: flagellar hook-associated protein FlgL [Selenomonas sp.]|uniref:flagellar hook-associated protein FlgL n=2 Tax=Selenomonas sp. TaxID=2053611 RepID=UPI0025F91046|nr:flagellar hook-associated protein FlgL [Selenomonas sp.]MCI6087039.1 flagellar hook-associated protein FlgL [Selenomonas sp.]